MTARLYISCEGSNLLGHQYWAETIGSIVICQMCGGHFEAPEGSPDTVPLHDRYDILAMVASHFGAVDDRL